SDPLAVLAALNDALTTAASAAGGTSSGGFSLGSILGGLQLSHAQDGSALVVSTSQQAVDAFTGDGPKLSGDATFQDAQQASNMPDQTTGFAYVDLKDALPLVQGLAALAGNSSTIAPDLGALHTLTAYGSGTSDGVERFTVFLEVQ
ncbi:MAG TPA: hypothetical protein VFN33_05890, partial [Gaiellaceae bacterium]|nr:hypothetical protein [Gaiellaceae bacterium]